MQFSYFDIHSHLNLKPLYEGRADILARMREEKIGTITVGVDYETSKLAIDLAQENPDMLWATVGLHPNDNQDEIFDYEKYLELAQNPKVVAIGETGLDYFRLDASRQELVAETKAKQKELFLQHIKLALEVKKPLMIHARPSKGSMDAYEDVIEILEQHASTSPQPSPNLGEGEIQRIHANFHFFVGDTITAQRIVKNGWTMSFDGPVTFSRDYDDVIRAIPLENIMAETDAPFAAPEPYRGKACEPWMVSEIVKKIAEIKNLPIETVQKALLENVVRVFDIQGII